MISRIPRDKKRREKFTIYTNSWEEFLARSFIERRRKIIYHCKLPIYEDVDDIWEYDPLNREVKRMLVITLENKYILPVEYKAKKIFEEKGYYVKTQKGEEFDEGIYFVYIKIDGKKNGNKIMKIPPSNDELNKLMSLTPKFLKEIKEYIKPYEQENEDKLQRNNQHY